MFCQGAFDHFAQFKLKESKSPKIDEITQKVDIDSFEQMMVLTLQTCDELELEKSTKYCALKYMESYVASLELAQELNQQKAEEISYACIWIAAQTKENKDLLATIYYDLNPSNFQALKLKAQELRTSIKKTLQSKVDITTPYMILEYVCQVRPQLAYFTDLVINFIELAVSLPTLIQYSAEQIFWGCFNTAVIYKKPNFNMSTQQFINAFSIKSESVARICIEVEKDFVKLISQTEEPQILL